MTRRLAATLLGALLALGAVTACDPGPSVEVEDCDPEDRRRREPDCRFLDRRVKPKPATKSRSKPKPQKKRR